MKELLLNDITDTTGWCIKSIEETAGKWQIEFVNGWKFHPEKKQIPARNRFSLPVEFEKKAEMLFKNEANKLYSNGDYFYCKFYFSSRVSQVQEFPPPIRKIFPRYLPTTSGYLKYYWGDPDCPAPPSLKNGEIVVLMQGDGYMKGGVALVKSIEEIEKYFKNRPVKDIDFWQMKG